MIGPLFSFRVDNAALLQRSRFRRYRYSFNRLAATHAAERFLIVGTEKSQFDYASISPQDMELIGKIVDRGMTMAAAYGVHTVDRMLALMDISTLHCNGTPLRLYALLLSNDDDFSHDFAGIGRWIDRKAGVLTGGFKLRFAAQKN